MKGKYWEIPYRPITADQFRGNRPPLLEAVLALREIPDQQADDFLHPTFDSLGDAMLLQDMPKAVARLKQAIANREKVAIYGDYDVDGITSLSIIYSYLSSKGVECFPYIPDRIDEGYGVNQEAVEALADEGVTLIITVDCGITAAAETEYAKSRGVDMIITDHHECRGFTLPDAVAVIDPKREDCAYGFDALAGCGVAFKLICALDGNPKAMLDRYADLVAVGTVADVMPMIGENRYLVQAGLRKLIMNPRPGLAALMSKALTPGKEISASTISFSLAPRINAAGRLGQTPIAVRLMLSENKEQALQLAQELCDLNVQRQQMEQDIWLEAVEMVKQLPTGSPLVLASESWHKGIVGIIASRLSEQFSVPSVMICLDGDEGKGSCRSYGNFDLFAALSACADHLESFGGHALAAGLSIHRNDLDAFREALHAHYIANPPGPVPDLQCELLIGDSELLTIDCVESIGNMEPYGNSNPKPLMCITGIILDQITPIGGGKHLRLKFRSGSRVFDGIYFGCSYEKLGLMQGDLVDVAFSPQINNYRDQRSVQLLVSDVRANDAAPLCRRLLLGDMPAPMECPALLPERKQLASLWRKFSAQGGTIRLTMEEILQIHLPDISPAKFCTCMRIFREAGLIEAEFGNDMFTASIIPRTDKADLNNTPLLRHLNSNRR
ncbi:MAG: single-stranded-DNA-specific exonuclease RecJ [Oscillospiraceae bacterium]|nr:single-stranded-DNA-specific exonuclease RecJ [Oscillospiraceae bacterium]